MKIQCELCREIVPIGAFRVAGDGIEVTCEACGDSFFVSTSGEPAGGERGQDAGAASESPREAVAEHEMRCPKCDLVQPRTGACRACGLRAELFEEYALEHAEEAPPELEALWECCEAEWDDEAAHDRFVEGAAVSLAYAYAARRYRSVLRRRGDDPIAHRQLDRLARMAEVTLTSAAAARRHSDAGDEPYKKVIMLLMVLVLLAGIGGMYLLLKRAKDVGSETRQPAPVTAPGSKR